MFCTLFVMVELKKKVIKKTNYEYESYLEIIIWFYFGKFA